MTLRALVVVMVLGALLAARGVEARDLPVASARNECSAYDGLLRGARERLELGDRSGALVLLKEAREALADCLRESAEMTALAALD